jgi:hypothetical protein
MPATALVVASDAPASIRGAALEAKPWYEDLIQILTGTNDEVAIASAVYVRMEIQDVTIEADCHQEMATTQLYGIQMEGGTRRVKVLTGSKLRNNQTAAVLIGTAADMVNDVEVENCLGYVTKNSGSSTGTGAQQTIPHGLSFTPTTAQIALWDIEVGANPYHSAAPDANNIYVTAVLNQDWGWGTVG